LHRRLSRLDELGKRNSAFCRGFISYLLAKGFSYARANAYIDTFLTFGKFVGKRFDQVSRKDVERFFEWMKKNGYKEWTIASAKARLKRFYKWLLGDDERYPPQVSWISTTSFMRNQLPKEILTVEEVNAMANAADNIRDKALVLTLYESGLRAGEFLDLRMRDVEVDKYGVVLHVSGKTGDRRVRVISAAPALLEWVNHHPKRNDPQARVFGKSPNYDRMSYTALNQILKKLAKKAGIKKNVHPHLLRHSRATHLARHLTEAQLNQFFGWTQGSRMAQVYVHLSGRDLDPALLKLAGLEAEAEEVEDLGFKPTRCPRCGELNPPNEKSCKKCGLPLDPSAYLLAKPSEELEKKLTTLEERLLKLESKVSDFASAAEKISQLIQYLEKTVDIEKIGDIARK